nr:hypothetical protein CTI12_AA475510 [Tanacetum cinerariifolium]
MEECHKMLTNQVDWMNPEGEQVRIDVNRPLPLGGSLGHVTIQTQFFFNKDLEYLRYGNKGSSPALSISKMKAVSYLDFGLELLVPEQMWIDDVCTYDISAKYAYSRYGYDYLSKIILRRVDFQEQTIVEKDFKNLHPSDFDDLNLLLLQGHLDHLPGSDKRMLSTADVTKSKEFIAAIERRLKTRRIYRNLECFVGGRVHDIDSRLLLRTKWSKEFIAAIERRLKTRRIYRNLECFVGGRVHDIDYRLLLRTKCCELCQGDSSKVYMITGSIYTDQWGTVVLATLFNESEQRHLRLVITNVYLQES